MSTTSDSYAAFNHFLAQTYGILLAGIFTGCVLFGIVCLQVFLYYTSKSKDPVPMRALPAFLIIMEFLHQVLRCVAVYKVVISNFGNQGVAVLIVPELFIASFFQGFCATSAHIFYTYRIWKFSKGLWIVPCITIPLSLVQLGFTLANNALTLIHRDIAYLPSIDYTVYIVHGVNVFLDVFFVVAMVLLLSKERHLFKQTQSMIGRLTMLVINTGLITTVSALLCLIFVRVQPDTFTYGFFNILVSPLYGISVMANLNSREYVRGHRNLISASSNLEMSSWKATTNSVTRNGTHDNPISSDSKNFIGGVTISQDTITRKDDQVNYQVGYKATGDV